jgi:very-short-patch-repair endonuclease
MHKHLYDQEEMHKRGLVTDGFYLPYNPKLIPRANDLRRNMTPAERKLWQGLLKDYPLKFGRQKVIDNFIVDFFCAKLNLVIEIDGGIHNQPENVASDQERTNILESYNLKVIRIRNEEIENDFDRVCAEIKKLTLCP